MLKKQCCAADQHHQEVQIANTAGLKEVQSWMIPNSFSLVPQCNSCNHVSNRRDRNNKLKSDHLESVEANLR